MRQTMTAAAASDPVRSLDNIGPASDQIGPKQAKAELRGLPFHQVMTDAAIRYYGSVKAMAYALGKVDPSLMMRELKDGKFARFDEHADEPAKAFVAAALVDAYGPLTEPQARIRQLTRNVRAELDEIDSLSEAVNA
jgi:hypothetical protein